MMVLVPVMVSLPGDDAVAIKAMTMVTNSDWIHSTDCHRDRLVCR